MYNMVLTYYCEQQKPVSYSFLYYVWILLSIIN